MKSFPGSGESKGPGAGAHLVNSRKREEGCEVTERDKVGGACTVRGEAIAGLGQRGDILPDHSSMPYRH